MGQTEVRGIDVGNVTAWYEANVPGTHGALDFTLIAGGHSNLTYVVEDEAGRKTVLRRPPLGQVLATAHDMKREHRIISALGPTDVPVPPVLGLCEDVDVNGAPFYVMSFVEGNIVRDAATAERLYDEEGRRRAGESIVDVLAAIHEVDIAAGGLDDLGKHDGYIARQLKRWYTQFQASNELTKRPVPLVHELHDRLAGAVPEQQGTGIVHGDYRLDNCMLSAEGPIAAVLDWELCTLGDPLADVGLLMVYWNDPDDEGSALLATPTAVEGFPRRKELVERYAAASSRDLSGLDYYVAFGYWKLACILEGVYSRYAGGVMGSSDGVEGFERQVRALAERAAATAEQAGI
jgi:aminoglycoside phosphotransferase (APT) family kinase protein